MNALPAAADRQQRLLRALGVTPYRLRGASPGRAAAPVASDAVATVPATAMAPTTAPVGAGVACVLILPQAADPRALHLLGRALHGFGPAFARAPRIDVVDGELRHPPPPAAAYLVFGQAQAHALGRVLPAAAMRAAQVQMLDEPHSLMGADGKRRLWQALCSLRRGLRQATLE